MEDLQQVLREVRTEIGTPFMATTVADTDGATIASGSNGAGVDADEVSASLAEVMELAVQVADRIDIGSSDYSLITTDQAFILTRSLGDGSFYWGLAVTREATLGMLRMLMNEYADRLWDAIPR